MYKSFFRTRDEYIELRKKTEFDVLNFGQITKDYIPPVISEADMDQRLEFAKELWSHRHFLNFRERELLREDLD